MDGQRQGVHAFFLPIRADAGQPLPGITIEDCGRKYGLNGIDNGRIAFDHVRIPRENLLDRFGGVSADGTYTSTIASPTRRFFTMLGTLVAGRISIAAASLSAAKTGLTIAVRYADRRRQFGPEGKAEVPILDYLTMQRRLLPAIAAAIALDFAMVGLVRRYAERASHPGEEIEGLAAAFKAYASTFAVETLHSCRDACGGQGYLAASRLPALIADTEIFTTFEGANTVLLQLVTKGLLSGYRQQFGELNLWGIVRHLGSRAAANLAELNPVNTRRTDHAHLRDPAFHVAALRWREDRLLATLARRLKRRIDAGEDSFSALNACQDHAVALANAHVQRLILERLQEGVASCTDTRLRPVLDEVAALHGLITIERDRGWFLEKGYLEPNKARALRDSINALCVQLRPHAVALVDGFGIPEVLLPEIARRALENK
jgi:acyl-CoA oxidase